MYIASHFVKVFRSFFLVHYVVRFSAGLRCRRFVDWEVAVSQSADHFLLGRHRNNVTYLSSVCSAPNSPSSPPSATAAVLAHATVWMLVCLLHDLVVFIFFPPFSSLWLSVPIVICRVALCAFAPGVRSCGLALKRAHRSHPIESDPSRLDHY